jgi:hypothetical protein
LEILGRPALLFIAPAGFKGVIEEAGAPTTDLSFPPPPLPHGAKGANTSIIVADRVRIDTALSAPRW